MISQRDHTLASTYRAVVVDCHPTSQRMAIFIEARERERFDRHGWNRRIVLLSLTVFLFRPLAISGLTHSTESKSDVIWCTRDGGKKTGFYQGIKVLKGYGKMARHFDTITVVASLRVEGCEARSISG